MRMGQGGQEGEEERAGLEEDTNSGGDEEPMPEANSGAESPTGAEEPSEERTDYTEDLGAVVATGHPDIFQVTYRIRNFSRTKHKAQINSQPFEVGGVKWSILLFPQGSKAGVPKTSNHMEQLGIFLDSAPHKEKNATYTCSACFEFSVISTNPAEIESKSLHHNFTPDDSDWGFHSFIRLSQLFDPKNGYLPDDLLTVKLIVRVLREDETKEHRGSKIQHEMLLHDSKTDTGFVGLKNQGATCYMNSLLQALFHVPALQRAVFQMPTEHETKKRRRVSGQHPAVVTRDNGVQQAQDSVALALQRVFYRLHYNATSVGTKALTKSFGWDALDSFTQHDVQELDRVLCDNLEEKMKGTEVEGAVPGLFRGKLKNFVKCIGVDFESVREEEYYDLSLNVKGCKNLTESLKNYVEVENLDGDNKYMAEGHGLVDAEKGCTFLSFPPVLHLHLKRFEYDPMKDANVKINDRFEFDQVMDLAPYLEKIEGEQHPPLNYLLHSVLVHCGDVHGGHYYAFVRPTCGKDWFKFNDEVVSRVTMEEAVSQNYGTSEDGEAIAPPAKRGISNLHRKFSSAYMLVYVREDAASEVLRPMKEEDIPAHLRDRFTEESTENDSKKKEKRDAHLQMHVKIATHRDMRDHNSSELVDWDKVLKLTARKDDSFQQLRKTLEETTHIPAERQRLWYCIGRKNCTIRPEVLIRDEADFKKYVGNQEKKRLLQEPEFPGASNCSCFLEELPEGADADFDLPPDEEKPALLFFKLFDCLKGTLTFVGHTIVSTSSTLGDVIKKAREELLPELADEELLVYEECTPNDLRKQTQMCKPIKDFEWQVGDIVVLERWGPGGREAAPRDMRSATGHYDFLINNVEVRFRDIAAPDKDVFTVVLHSKSAYYDILEKVAGKLKADGEDRGGEFFQLWKPMSHQPEAPQSFPWMPDEDSKLDSIHFASANNQDKCVLFFERTDFDIRDLEKKILLGLKVPLGNPQPSKGIYWAVVDKEHWIEEAIDVACARVPELPRSRAMLIKVVKCRGTVPQPGNNAPRQGGMEMMNYQVLVAHKEVPAVAEEEELSAENSNYEDMANNAVVVYHFDMERGQRMVQVERYWGTPLVFLPIDGESVGEFKARVRRQAYNDVQAGEEDKGGEEGAGEEELPNWRVVVLGPHGILDEEYAMEDDAALIDHVALIHGEDAKGRCYAIEHPDKNRHANANRTQEKSIRIAR